MTAGIMEVRKDNEQVVGVSHLHTKVVIPVTEVKTLKALDLAGSVVTGRAKRGITLHVDSHRNSQTLQVAGRYCEEEERVSEGGGMRML
jgi:hypothetical protein